MSETDKLAVGILFLLTNLLIYICFLGIVNRADKIETQIKELKPVAADCSGVVTRDLWDPFMGKKFIIPKHYFPPIERNNK